MAFEASAPVSTFLQQPTQAAMKTTGLGLYLTQTSTQTITMSGAFALTLTLQSAINLTLPNGAAATMARTDAAQTFTGASTATSWNLTTPVIAGYAMTGSGTIGNGCVMTTPNIGAATATSINGLTITSSTGVLTIAAGVTLAVSNTLTFTGTNATSFAFPSTSGTVVTLAATQTLTNKTLTSPTMTAPILGVATCDTINNMSITAAAGGGFVFSNDLVYTFVGDDVTFTATGITSLTLPTTGTLATLAGSESLTTKTLVAPVISTGLTASGSASNDFSASTGAFKTSSGLATISGALAGTVQSLAGAGAVNLTTLTTELTTTGAAQALTLADGTQGQIKIIIHGVDGGSAVLTPTTKTGYTTVTFAAAGESVMLQFMTSRGWIIIGDRGVVIA